MNFSELKTEFYARGTDYLEEDAAGVARAERWLNDAYREIVNLQPWPFLESSVTGPAPLSVPDLRKILNVYRTASYVPLDRTTTENLHIEGATLSQSGTPERYYIGSGNTVHTMPSNGEDITVRYVRRVAPLSGTDVPVFDEEYHNLIVDRAMVKAYKDSDNFESAAALKAEFDAGVSAMAEDYMLDSREQTYVIPSGSDL